MTPQPELALGSFSMQRNIAPSTNAGDRLFRAYLKHCQEHDEDTLFNFLNALHSFNDKLKMITSYGLEESKYFIGLRALRNLFHHNEELLNEINFITEFGDTLSVELNRVCLVSTSLVELASRGRKKENPPSPDVVATFKHYGSVVDIEPAIFNVCVDAYEALETLEIPLTSEAYLMFNESYEHEEREGIPHHVKGEISAPIGDISGILSRLQMSRVK